MVNHLNTKLAQASEKHWCRLRKCNFLHCKVKPCIKSLLEDRTALIQTYPRPRARMCEMSKEGIKTLRNSAEKMPPFFMTPLFLILRDTERRGCLKWNSLRGIINQPVNVKLFQYPAMPSVNQFWCESLLTSAECFPVCWTNQRPSLLLCWVVCLPLCPAPDRLPLTANGQVAHLSFKVKWKDLKRVWTLELNVVLPDYHFGWASPHQTLSGPHPDLGLVAYED